MGTRQAIWLERWTLSIVKRAADAGFQVPPRRWVVECTLAWLNRKLPPRQRHRDIDCERWKITSVKFLSLGEELINFCDSGSDT